LLTVFSMWWFYFAKPAAESLVSRRVGFLWGYGHFVVFASAAAVGAGVGAMVDAVTDTSHVSDPVAAASFTVPVILYVLSVAWIQVMLHGAHRRRLAACGVAVVLMGGATFTGQPVLLTGILFAALVASLLTIGARESASG
jgi:low temperature requirement protein LtrA